MLRLAPTVPVRPLLPKALRARRLALLILVIAPFAFGALALALGQDANWDLRNYHWYNGYALLNWRYDTDLLPSQIPWFVNPALDVPFYLLATHVPARVAGFALGFVQGLNFPLLFMLAHAALNIPDPPRKVLVSAALALLGMLGGGALALIGTTFYDNVTSLGIFGSALLVLCHARRLDDETGPRSFALACLTGLPAGMVTGLKLPAAVFAVGLCGGLLFAGRFGGRRLLIAFGFGIGVLIGIAVTYGYWAWFLETRFDNPFFPFFNQIFKSPLMPPISARDDEFIPDSIMNYLMLPFDFALNPKEVGEIDWRDWGIPLLYVLLPVAVALRLIFSRTRQAQAVAVPFATRYLLWAASLAYGAWLVMFCVYRYAVPLEMMSPLLIVLAAGLLPVRPAPRALLTVFLLVIVAGSIRPGNWGRRAVWLDRFVEASIPPIENPQDLMILMAGQEPYSHLLPEFPPAITFVRIESNFSDPHDGFGINKLIRARIEQHRGQFMILIPPYEHEWAQASLSAFNLAAQWNACRKVIDRLYDDAPMDLCPVASLVHEGQNRSKLD